MTAELLKTEVCSGFESLNQRNERKKETNGKEKE